MVLKAQFTNRKNKNNSKVEFLDACDIDDEGFIEGSFNTGNVLRAFNFGMSAAPDDNKSIAPKVPT